MTDGSLKDNVVGLDGQPVVVSPTTEPRMLEFIDAMKDIASGEKHVACGMFLVDDMGRVWTNF